MNIWFLFFILFHLIGLKGYLDHHGKIVKVRINFWSRLVSLLISVSIVYMAIKTGL